MANSPVVSPPDKKEQEPGLPTPPDRRNQERRQASSEGYVYIPMVGWYCRRDATRRRTDTFDLPKAGENGEGGA